MPRWRISVLMVVLLAACSTPMPSTTPTLVRTATVAPTATPTPVARSEPVAPIDPFAQARRLGRGINLANALEAPREGEGGIVLAEEHLQVIAEAGFDTIRVPIRWSAHAMTEPPYTVDETFFWRIDWVIENGLERGLNVIIDMHHYEELYSDPPKHQERFIAIWRQIATRYRYQPDSLYLEPLNEPHGQLSPTWWNGLLGRVVTAIREVDGVHTLIVDAAAWGSIQGLLQLEIPEGEENAIASFHFYEPFPFTHQGVEGTNPEFGTTGVQWPGPPATPLAPNEQAQELAWVRKWFEDYNTLPTQSNPCSPREIAKQLGWVEQWTERSGKPLFMGEFGTYSAADTQSRVNWTTTVRQEAEARGFSWAYWEFGAGFGIYDTAAHRWNQELLGALIPGSQTGQEFHRMRTDDIAQQRVCLGQADSVEHHGLQEMAR